ncbi:hypothetical protein K432DRAFT_214233 [Lepidopterella palustris CBS 459.81]|uniref:Uncharacterized protein n=1 Tax=Lepidopterella palustris CBS 459.81 TaxID=1314670 RepID=A0A8E2DYC8_9PEZI|nr:hypothetical protein K432DRAFT_214233 [Lepidopterella palustris CBS 459.81]
MNQQAATHLDVKLFHHYSPNTISEQVIPESHDLRRTSISLPSSILLSFISSILTLPPLSFLHPHPLFSFVCHFPSQPLPSCPIAYHIALGYPLHLLQVNMADSQSQSSASTAIFTERETKMLGWVMMSLKSGPPEVI